MPEGEKFRNTPSACGGDRNFEDFANLFVFPYLNKEGDILSNEIVEPNYFFDLGENAVIIKGRDFSGKTALLRWLFLRFSENYYPIFVDGNGILKSLNFEDLSQNGINMELLRDLSVEFSKSKNYWAQTAVSFQVQNYLNTHRVGYKDAQKINDLLGIKYLPKGNLK